jgi:hypothetical protein
VGLQPHPVHRQAAAGDHQDLVLLEKCTEDLAPTTFWSSSVPFSGSRVMPHIRGIFTDNA